jgi:hypothetical protein
MFVERSESRVRSARTAFVLVCLVPCAVLAAWAAYWKSGVHHDAAAAAWGREIGLAVRCERVDHVRPGCVRLSNCKIGADDGSAAASFDVVEVETTPGEVRIRLPEFHATGEACAAIGRLARNWLTEPARHPRAWLIDVASVQWPDGDDGTRKSAPGVRVECVAVGSERAVRIRREPATSDEVRIVRSADGQRGRFVIEAKVDDPVPAACVVAAIGLPVDGIAGWCSGSIAAEWSGDGWSGEASGSLDRFDANSIASFFGSPMRMEGPARFDLVSATLSAGRIVRANATIDVAPAVVSQELLERFVQVMQCRAGEEYLGRDAVPSSLGVRQVDRVACSLAIDASGARIRPAEAAGRGIVTAGGRTVLEAPSETVAIERIPWAFAPRDARPLPATDATAWLTPLLPPSPSPERR